MPTQTPAVAHFPGSTPAFRAEQENLLRAADGLRGRLKRAPRLTELLQLFHALGYRRLPPELVVQYDAGDLQSSAGTPAGASAPLPPAA
jgi:hypothetical protein